MGRIRSGRYDGKLTPLKVSRVMVPGLYADGNGLYLRVPKSTSQTRARSWMLVYFAGGKRREMGLGSVSAYTLAEARELARTYRQAVDRGEDPIDTRREALAATALAQANRKTFKECAEEYVRLHASTWRSAKHAAQWPSTLEKYAYPAFGERPVSTIGKADILGVLEPIWHEKTETATRVRQRVRAVLEWAASRDYRVGHDPALWAQIDRSLPKASRIAKRGSFAACAYPEVYAVMRAVWASPATDAVKAAFSFAVLTAARSGEVRGARWSEVDGDTWTIPGDRMKAGREHRVPLSAQALAVLPKRPEVDGLVFPTAKGTTYSDMVFTKRLRDMGYTFTMHGFRSSFRDWAAEQTNFPREVVEQALAHVVENKTEAAYFRSDLFDRRRELMAAWGVFCTTEPAAPAPKQE